jgi:hypothetical protein
MDSACLAAAGDDVDRGAAFNECASNPLWFVCNSRPLLSAQQSDSCPAIKPGGAFGLVPVVERHLRAKWALIPALLGTNRGLAGE